MFLVCIRKTLSKYTLTSTINRADNKILFALHLRYSGRTHQAYQAPNNSILTQKRLGKLNLWRSNVWQQCWGVEDVSYAVTQVPQEISTAQKASAPHTLPNAGFPKSVFQRIFLHRNFYKISYSTKPFRACNITLCWQVLPIRHTEVNLGSSLMQDPWLAHTNSCTRSQERSMEPAPRV